MLQRCLAMILVSTWNNLPTCFLEEKLSLIIYKDFVRMTSWKMFVPERSECFSLTWESDFSCLIGRDNGLPN